MKILFLFLLTITFSSVSAQSSGGLFEGLNHQLTLISNKEKPRDLEGSPYYHNEFINGIVNFENKSPVEVYLRYNVAEELIEIKPILQNPEVYQLAGDSKTTYIIKSEKYVLDRIVSSGKEFFGYFIEIYKGGDIRLLKKPIARFTEREKAKSGYENDTPARISINEEYFIIHQGDVINVRPRSNDVKKVFKSAAAKEFLKNNKIKTEADLKSFVIFIDK